MTENVEFPHTYSRFSQIFNDEFQERSESFSQIPPSMILTIDEHSEHYAMPIEIGPSKTLYINSSLSMDQQDQLIKVLKEQSGAFAWEYTDMKGIHPDTYVHHIYIEADTPPVRQPQRRMNPILKDFVKEELHKLLNA